jgi:hypothetical protein
VSASRPLILTSRTFRLRFVVLLELFSARLHKRFLPLLVMRRRSELESYVVRPETALDSRYRQRKLIALRKRSRSRDQSHQTSATMSEGMQAWTLFFGAATLFLILVQVAILGGLLWALRLIQSTYSDIQQSLKAEGLDSRQLVSDLHRMLVTVERAATKTAELADSAGEVIAKTKKTVDQVEASLDSAADSIGHARSTIQRGLAAPLQEYRAIIAAVRCGLGALRRHSQSELLTNARR